MSTIHMPYRPPGYLARQGYVKPLWEIVFRRTDNWWRYVPDDEAYNLPALSEKLESDKYSISTIDHVTVELTRTDELVDFLKGLKDPKRLRIKIFTYLTFRKGQKQLVWFGQLQNLPEGVDAYPWDKLKLTFMSPPGAWEDGDAVKDPATKSAYRNKHVTDLLLPKFLEKARWQGKGGTRDWMLEPPDVRGENYFWSGVEVPAKKLATTMTFDGGGGGGGPCKVTAMCWDSNRELLYLGVHEGPGSKTLPWLVSYDPKKRKWAKVTQFRYTGKLSCLWLCKTGWEVQHLEYSDNKVYFVCRTDSQDILEKEAHYKCRGVINMASSVPKTVALTDNNLFTLHDKGISIRSRHVHYQNKHPVWVGEKEYYVDAFTETIGWGTPRHDKKEAGVLWSIPRQRANLASEYTPKNRDRILQIYMIEPASFTPFLSQRVIIRHGPTGYQQYLGEVKHVNRIRGNRIDVTVGLCAKYVFPPYSEVTFHSRDKSPAFNVFIAEPQEIQLEYIYDEGFASLDSEAVLVEARFDRAGRDEFWWPDIVGEITDTSKYRIDRVGYTSFISLRELHEAETYKYRAGFLAPYKITLQGYNPAFLIEDGFWVASLIQDQNRWRRCQYPAGRCRLVHNGKYCVAGSDKIETYGKIFLFKDNSGIYCAWNDHDQDTAQNWFSQCKIAKWKGDNKFRLLWTYRDKDNWSWKPELYITSFARYKNRFYLGVKYYQPNWVDTNLQIFWAKAPFTDLCPTEYACGPVVLCAVKGDMTDVLEPGSLVWLRDEEKSPPCGKHYRIAAEVTAEQVRVDAAEETKFRVEYTFDRKDYAGMITWFPLLLSQRWAVIGRYISVMKGRDERHRIMELKI